LQAKPALNVKPALEGEARFECKAHFDHTVTGWNPGSMAALSVRKKIPEFGTEAQEAAWWDAQDRRGKEPGGAMRNGTAQRGTAQRLALDREEKDETSHKIE
jgi:hypothetical protein